MMMTKKFRMVQTCIPGSSNLFEWYELPEVIRTLSIAVEKLKKQKSFDMISYILLLQQRKLL